ncbi:MAG TPA: helix-turn-helix domain-containing protein [Mycobacteriales bacterium]|nr:helix-turn-helix domain-containing protein [Mycobacteriales bacterium]
MRTKEDFARELTALRERAGLSLRDLARRSDAPLATVGGYLSGKHLPQASSRQVLERVLAACGVTAEADVLAWLDAAARARRAPGARPATDRAPYRGLASFGVDDAAWFFGRDDLVATLADLVRTAEPGVPVVVLGASGSGKSSLLKAGLVPALTAEGWTSVVTTPGADPLERLAAATAGVPAQRAEEPAGTLLVVDQLEEVFAHPPEVVQAFAAELVARAAASPVVVAVRSDFFAQLTAIPDLLRSVQEAQVVVGPMTAAQLRDVVVEPARRAQVEVEPALVDVVLRDVRVRGAGTSPAGALPLLSHALLATWERGSSRRLTVADYEQAGGIEAALARTAEQVWAGLDPAAQQAARTLLLGLVRLVDGVPMARRGLGRGAVAGEPAAEAALDALVAARLLTAAEDEVELAHEALLWAWPRLAGWVEDDRDDLRVRALLDGAARSWQDNGRDAALLHRGAPLAAVLAWRDGPGRDVPLAPAEREFLSASVSAAGAEQQRDRRTSARLRRLSALLAMLLVVSVGLGAVSVHQTQRQSELRERADSRQLASVAERLRTVDPALSAQLALAGYRESPTPEALAALLAAASAPHGVRLIAGEQVQQAVTVSPDGARVVSVGADAELHQWTTGGEPLGEPVPAGDQTLYTASFSPDGDVLVAAGGGQEVLRWQVGDDGALEPLPPLTGPEGTVYATAFAPDGRLAASTSDGRLWLWPAAAPAAPTAVDGVPVTLSDAALQGLAFSPDGGQLAAAAADGVVHVVDVTAEPRVLPNTSTPADAPLLGVAFAPDGALYAGGRDRTVHRFAVGEQVTPAGAPLEGPDNWVNGVAVSPDGGTLAGASSDGSTWLWDTATGQVVGRLAQPGPVTAVRWAGDDRLVTAGTDGTVRLWTFPTPSVGGAGASQFSASYSPDGRWLATAGSDGLRLLPVRDGLPTASRPVVVPSPDGSKLSGTSAFSPDGRLVAAGGAAGAVHLVDVTGPAPQVVASMQGSTELVEQVAFSPDGRLLAAGGDDNAVQLYDVAERRLLATVTGPESYVYTVAFSPDSRTLAVGSVDTTVRLYDVTSPEGPRAIGEPIRDAASYVYNVQFSPDGRLLAAGGDDKRIRLYDVGDLERPRMLGEPVEAASLVMSTAFRPDGRRLAVAVGDGTALLVDVSADGPRVETVLPASTAATNAVAFSRDGRTLVTTGADRAARFWPLDAERAAERICAGGGQPLTREEWARYAPDARFTPPCR